ncbi:MAG TPA: cytochrome c1 [Ottowia sp.]|uniref:cytochrome c1 n=1 Tax=Ottowia sp. TaxID=1898956 RepID=UPI002CDFCA39|nr:cytochrome c1 [Ottowia sp.]HMN19881.1 cytochrome c1 [Ottowia sp.]
MNIWKKLVFGLTLALGLAGAGQAAISWDKAPGDTTNNASLQRGAKIFVNYCLNCHSAAFMRFNRLQDIGLTDEQIKDNLLFLGDKVGVMMKAAIDPVQAKEWFGANPPDLTVIARSRSGSGGTGADYVYTLLRSYFRDDDKPTGWDNLTFPSIGMPHPLWELQGERRPVFQTDEGGDSVKVFTGKWEQVTPGTLTPLEYEQAVGDLANYLQWMGEPAQNKRVRIGVWVMLFLALFTIIAWRLNAAYWKDVK